MQNPNVGGAEIFSVRDIIDSQLETCDGVQISRVADIEVELYEDGTLVLTNIIIGPQALAKRVAHFLHRFFRFLLRDRFEYFIPLSDVKSFGPTLHLRKKASNYPTKRAEKWVIDHILRWIPGSGYTAWKKNQSKNIG